MRWLWNWWRARQRAIDLEILWPICKREALNANYAGPSGPLDHAKAAFAVHAFNDPAWLALGEEKIIEFIDDLR